MSVARVAQLSQNSVGKTERHNERKNTSYENINVEPERISMNVSFKSPADRTYNECFSSLLSANKISVRGLKDNATHFDEMIIDVNTEYFEENGGYDFARRFYEEAYRFCCGFYGEDCIVSAVMHADELNREVSDRLGKKVYHYHLHVVAIPTVEKEVRWSARCKDEALRGKVKEVIRQVSHSKKWESHTPMLDENGNPMYNSAGKPVFVKSYSVLQDRLYEHMTAAGFTGFGRGVRNSTAEHLTSLQYQIAKDAERLSEIEREVACTQEELEKVTVRYEKHSDWHKTYSELENAGKRSLGRYVLSRTDYADLVSLAKEGISSRGEVDSLKGQLGNSERRNWDLRDRINYLERKLSDLELEHSSLIGRYNSLARDCQPFLEALEIAGKAVLEFILGIVPEKRPEPPRPELSQKTQQSKDKRTR